MNLTTKLVTALVISVMSFSPAAADPGRGNGKGQSARHQHERGPRDGHRVQTRYVMDCPPGLAKKSPACVPPGQVGKRYGTRVGDTLRIRDYALVRDLGRYDLERRRGWNYYQDDNQIYRIDSSTRKIIAVLNLIDAFQN